MSTDLPLKTQTQSQVPPATQSRGVVFGDTQRTPRGNIRFASSSGATQNRVGFGQKEMGNSSSTPDRRVPMVRTESDIPHKSTEEQIEERARARSFSNFQNSLPNPAYAQTDFNSPHNSSINVSSKPSKSVPSTIAKTHRKIVSLGGLSKSSLASNTTNGIATHQLSSATVSGTGKPNSKLKVQIILNKPFYSAGAELTGYIELTSLTKESLGIADITLELTGFEELEPAAAPNIVGPSKPGQFGAQASSPTKTFYRTRLLLQDREHPCPAVQDVAYPDAEGFWPARKGKTTLPFLLRLAPTLPNAIVTSQGRVSYHLEAIIQLKSGIFKEIANFGRSVTILERWEPSEVSVYRGRGVRGETRKRLFMGGPRHLELESELVASLVAGGSLAYIRITVRNHTTKKVQGVRLTLLQTAGAHEGLGPNTGAEAPTRPAVEKILKDADLKFSPGEERSCIVAMEVPVSCLSLRHTVLLKVSYTLQVALISSLSKDLTVDLPIYISHPSSWSDPCPSIDKKYDELPASDLVNKTESNEQNLRSASLSPPLPPLPPSKDWANSIHSQSAENLRSGYLEVTQEEQGSISEGTSPLNSPPRAPSVTSFPLDVPLPAPDIVTSPNMNVGNPSQLSFFRRPSPANRPTTPSESTHEIFVGGRRYQLADSQTPPVVESSPRPHTVVDDYQIRSRPSNIPSQVTRHSSYVSSEQQEGIGIAPANSEVKVTLNRSRLEKDTFEPFSEYRQDTQESTGVYDFMDTPSSSSMFYQKKNKSFEEDEQYQWSSANQASNQSGSHHTPERNLSRHSTRIAIKRKSSTKVRTRGAARKPALPPSKSASLPVQEFRPVLSQPRSATSPPPQFNPVSPQPRGTSPSSSKLLSSRPISPQPISPPHTLIEKPYTSPEGMEAQLALLQKQMTLLMASLQSNTPPPLSFSPPTEKTSPSLSAEKLVPSDPKGDPSPIQQPPETPQKTKKKSKKSPAATRNLHHHRAMLNSYRSTNDSDWV